MERLLSMCSWLSVAFSMHGMETMGLPRWLVPAHHSALFHPWTHGYSKIGVGAPVGPVTRLRKLLLEGMELATVVIEIRSHFQTWMSPIVSHPTAEVNKAQKSVIGLKWVSLAE